MKRRPDISLRLGARVSARRSFVHLLFHRGPHQEVWRCRMSMSERAWAKRDSAWICPSWLSTARVV
eukprot:7937314-Alexandrium_andersonii.AAC.1